MSSTPTTDPGHRAVGRVIRPHGVRGEVVVEVHTDAPERRFASGSALHADTAELVVGSARGHQDRLLVRFDGVRDRPGAETLRGAELTLPVEALGPTDDPDEYHDHQLEGLTAIRRGGAVLGIIREILHAPGNDVLVLAADRGEVLVPFVHAIVPEVDLEAGRVVVDPPEGLLDA